MNNLKPYADSVLRWCQSMRTGPACQTQIAHDKRCCKLQNLVKYRLKKCTAAYIYCQKQLNSRIREIAVSEIKPFWLNFVRGVEDLILADFEEKLIDANVDEFREVLSTFKREHPQLFNEVKDLLGNLSNLSEEKKAILAGLRLNDFKTI